MWQAIMHRRRAPPAKAPGEFPAIPADGRAAQVRAIKAGLVKLFVVTASVIVR